MFKMFKNGMVVEFNDGHRRMVWDDKLIDNLGFIWLDNINSDLYNIDKIPYHSEYIVKIYEPINIGSMNDFFRDENLKLIFHCEK